MNQQLVHSYAVNFGEATKNQILLDQIKVGPVIVASIER